MKKKKFDFSRYIRSIMTIVIGLICGIILAQYHNSVPKEHIWEQFLWPIGLLIVLYLAMLIHMIIHEAGHLICGLISGYRFSSFRILSLMFVRENGKIKAKQMKIAGTGGQCLLSPPDMVGGKLPILLYNLGGPFFNLITGVIFLGIYYFAGTYSFVAASFLILAFVGFVFALLNGIPMRMGNVDNDGYNAYSMRKNEKALHAFWLQMKINESISNGLRLKDMPDEWFYMPDDSEIQNSMVAVIGVMYCNRLMDQHRFEEAIQAMDHMMNIPSEMVDIHRNMMLCDRLFLELIGEQRQDIYQTINSKQLQKFMKEMENFPSVIRTQYAYALIVEKNCSKCNALITEFNKHAKSYPYKQEVEAEQEYISLAQARTTDKKTDH